MVVGGCQLSTIGGAISSDGWQWELQTSVTPTIKHANDGLKEDWDALKEF